MDDLVFDSEQDSNVEEVTFSYVSSSPPAAIPSSGSQYTLVILDNDSECTHTCDKK